MNRRRQNNSWISFSDLMTGLMVIFMFIAIAYMQETQKKQVERDQLFEEFKITKQELYEELERTFKNDFIKWKVELDKDLSIKFTNPEVLFASGKTDIRPYFQQILDSFLPRYFNILMQGKYRDKIYEIRLEGHTDTVPAPTYDPDPYIGNMLLSQLRSVEVLKYFREMNFYRILNPADKRQLEFWLTANGLSYGRTLDKNKELTLVSGLVPDKAYSRRVEFRIVTTSDKLVEKVLHNISTR